MSKDSKLVSAQDAEAEKAGVTPDTDPANSDIHLPASEAGTLAEEAAKKPAMDRAITRLPPD